MSSYDQQKLLACVFFSRDETVNTPGLLQSLLGILNQICSSFSDSLPIFSCDNETHVIPEKLGFRTFSHERDII